MRAADLPAPDRKRAHAHRRHPEPLEAGDHADHVDERIDRPHLVEVDRLALRAVDRRLRLRERGEDRLGAGAHPRGQTGAIEARPHGGEGARCGRTGAHAHMVSSSNALPSPNPATASRSASIARPASSSAPSNMSPASPLTPSMWAIRMETTVAQRADAPAAPQANAQRARRLVTVVSPRYPLTANPLRDIMRADRWGNG